MKITGKTPVFSAIRVHFAFRRLCFAGCGNSCSFVIERGSPHPDPGGCRPHTPASSEIRANIMTHSFQRRPPFSALCIPEPLLRRVREQLFICYRECFPAPGFRGLPPPYPAFCEIRACNMTHSFQRRPPFSELCVPETMLRRVREQLFLYFRKSFPAPGFRGLPPPYPRFL